jgi:hypothetical protein
MCIYLYIKTHKKTGLKYLGKTSSNNPHTYPGSGVYWRKHLDKHGYDYDTKILKECQTNQEVVEWGQYYSKLWNVVASDEWANLTEENGSGGNNGLVWTSEMREEQSKRFKGQPSLNKGKTYKEIYGSEKAVEKVKKFKETYKKKLESKPPKEKSKKLPHGKARIGMTYKEIYGEEKAADIQTKQKEKLSGKNNPRYGKPGTFKNKHHTEESLAKMRQPTGPHNKKREILICPHCEKASDASNAKRWHFNNCKSKI